jgi:photosystem II stability/assembly factor-like uncharacterized protein
MTHHSTGRLGLHARLVLLIAGLTAVLAACGAGLPRVAPAAPSTGAWIGLTMADARHGWGVTTGALLRTDDGGQRWAAVSALPALDLSRGFAQAVAGPGTTWLCQQGTGRGTSPLRNPEGDPRITGSPLARCFVTGDAGTSWAVHDVPGTGSTFTARTRLDASVVSAAATDARQAWAVVRVTRTFAGGGHESFDLVDLTLLHTADGGASWMVQRRRTPAQDGSPNAPVGWLWVRAGAAGAVWLGGFTPGAIEVSRDGGDAWQPVAAPLPAPASPGEVAVVQPVQAAGGELLVPATVGSVSAGSWSVAFLRSRDAGQSWAATTARTVAVTSAPDVSALDGRRWWIAAGHTMHTTSDGGASWTTFQLDAPVPFVQSVQMLSPTAGLAVGVDPGRAPQRLLRTADGGRTWNPA